EERFVKRYHEIVRFVEAWDRWCVWKDEGFWEKSPRGNAVMRLAASVAQVIRDEAEEVRAFARRVFRQAHEYYKAGAITDGDNAKIGAYAYQLEADELSRWSKQSESLQRRQAMVGSAR